MQQHTDNLPGLYDNTTRHLTRRKKTDNSRQSSTRTHRLNRLAVIALRRQFNVLWTTRIGRNEACDAGLITRRVIIVYRQLYDITNPTTSNQTFLLLPLNVTTNLLEIAILFRPKMQLYQFSSKYLVLCCINSHDNSVSVLLYWPQGCRLLTAL